MAATEPRVVVIGGGFGGLQAVKSLRGVGVRVTLLDRRNHHVFQPFLYQVATGVLNQSEIAVPLRSIVRRRKDVDVFLAEAQSIDAAAKKVILIDGEVAYDFLVVATGATHSYYGHDEWAPLAPGLKTLEDALEIRSRVFLAYEEAEREADPQRKRAWMTFVIVGGGPTGAELAGQFAAISRLTLRRDFRHIDPSQARILVVEHAPVLLHTYPPVLCARAKRELEHLGIEVRNNAKVTSIDEHGVEISGERIDAETVIWAAGVRASDLVKTIGTPVDRAGRLLVEPDLTVPGHPEIFVVGDTATLQQGGKPVPGVAPAALQAGRHAARNIARTIRGKSRRPFHYLDKGSLATLGRRAAIGDIRGFHVWGFAAFVAWGLVHIFFLLGFRNRIQVLRQWMWSYLTFQRGARLITRGPLESAQLDIESPSLGTADDSEHVVRPLPAHRGQPGAGDSRPDTLH